MKANITNKAVALAMLSVLAAQEVHAIPVSRTTRQVFKMLFEEATSKSKSLGYDEVFKPSQGGVGRIRMSKENRFENSELVITEVRASKDDIAKDSTEVKAMLGEQELNDYMYLETKAELDKIIGRPAILKEELAKLQKQANYAASTPLSSPSFKEISVETERMQKAIYETEVEISKLQSELSKLVRPDFNTQIGDSTEISIYARKANGNNTTIANSATKELNRRLKKALENLNAKYGDNVVKISNQDVRLKNADMDADIDSKTVSEMIDFDGGISANIIVSELDAKDYLNFLAEASGLR